MSIGKFTAKAAGVAADAVGEVLGESVYPETQYGLAAFLFERIAVSERDAANRDRDYYFELMQACMRAVREDSAAS